MLRVVSSCCSKFRLLRAASACGFYTASTCGVYIASSFLLLMLTTRLGHFLRAPRPADGTEVSTTATPPPHPADPPSRATSCCIPPTTLQNSDTCDPPWCPCTPTTHTHPWGLHPYRELYIALLPYKHRSQVAHPASDHPFTPHLHPPLLRCSIGGCSCPYLRVPKQSLKPFLHSDGRRQAGLMVVSDPPPHHKGTHHPFQARSHPSNMAPWPIMQVLTGNKA